MFWALIQLNINREDVNQRCLSTAVNEVELNELAAVHTLDISEQNTSTGQLNFQNDELTKHVDNMSKIIAELKYLISLLNWKYKHMWTELRNQEALKMF